MVGSLLNLKRLEISKCHMMEEIIETNNGVALDEVFDSSHSEPSHHRPFLK